MSARSVVPAGCFWAKLSDDRQRWHSLLGHSADVAAVLEHLLMPESALSRRLAAVGGRDRLRVEDRAWLVRLAVLHDLGKTNRIFQSRKFLPWGARPRDGGHVRVLIESLSYAPILEVVRDVYPFLHADGLIGLDLFRAAISHHGRPWGDLSYRPALEETCWTPGDGLDPPAEMRKLAGAAKQWSDADVPPSGGLPITPAFTHLFAGLLTLADWIGSTEDAFPLCGDEADRDPAGYWQEAQRKAERACARIGVVPDTFPLQEDIQNPELLRRIFPDIFNDTKNRPRPVQHAAATMPLPSPGSAILIESETGSGKTEAALALFARMRAAEAVGGLFFALPTRATATAMHERIRDVLPRIYPDGAQPTVALAIGGRAPRFESSDSLVEQRPHTYDDVAEEERAKADVLLFHWAESGAKKFLAAEIVVGTVDQALLAALPVRHAHLRLAALTRHLLVVDELHSFDRYMGEVLQRLLTLHAKAGGSAVFMSATLSASARRRLEGGEPEDVALRAEVEAVDYPALWVREREGNWHLQNLGAGGESNSRMPEPKSIVWESCDEEKAIKEAVDAANQGARVCFLRNTVSGARRTLELLQAQPARLWRPRSADHDPPYHSRYAPPDRKYLDEAVRNAFGKNGSAEGGILVATQVVEQSLDIDFDLFITDCCPIDALLQRLGRLHRHSSRIRPPGFEQARAWIIAPADSFARWATAKHGGLNGWGSVYEDLCDLELTLALLRPGRSVKIPLQNRELIEAVYHPDSRRALESSALWKDYVNDADGSRIAQANHGREAALKFRYGYTAAEVVQQFDSGEEKKIRTRLGDDTVRLELPNGFRGWYSDDTVRFVDLPAYVVADDDTAELPLPEAFETGERGCRFRIGKRTVEYRPDGWHWSRAGREADLDE